MPIRPRTPASASNDVQLKVDWKGIDTDALVDIRRAETARDTAEHRETGAEAMLGAKMQRMVGFGCVERRRLRTESAGRGRVVDVTGREEGPLQARAPRQIGRWRQRQALLPVRRDRFLVEIVLVVGRIAEADAAPGFQGRIIIVEAGGDLGRHAEQPAIDDRARRDRSADEGSHIRRVRTEQRGKHRLVLAPQIAVEDQLDALPDLARQAEGQAVARLFRKGVRRGGAAPVAVHFA